MKITKAIFHFVTSHEFQSLDIVSNAVFIFIFAVSEFTFRENRHINIMLQLSQQLFVCAC